MKKKLLISALIILGHYSYAQPNRILPEGDVGIGTTLPAAKLDVSVSSSTLTNNIKFGDSSPAYLVSGTTGVYISNNMGKPLFMIQHTGNAGLGTISPLGTLHINGSQVLESPNAPAQLVISNSTDITNNLMLGYDNTVDAGIISAAKHDVGWRNLVLNPYAGNVGIGITNPKERLEVNGTIHSRAVRVDLNGWADYVLKPDYRLPTLSEVKAFIDQNQHLPDIPSEKEVIRDGLNLGEMNKLLTKKIEELTLYLIVKEQQISELNQKQQAQTEINLKLQKQLNSIQDQLNSNPKKQD
ncbi:hypothetical protein [Pedobacter cryoconitis]|uniref:BZIP transcription factor n=1 Tax=Pedobacter cryoconitis TaxID=188932 RepID=A0A7X0MMA5_9SPHI|nr:hypothetical protein [Pedobacter cryoconitis]MBB6502263.1 hypothetical protein [Pedobacter cryoconitis]